MQVSDRHELDTIVSQLQQSGERAVAVVLDPGNDTPRSITIARGQNSNDAQAPTAYCIELPAELGLESLRTWWAGSHAPYVVFHDAQVDLRRIENLGLRPRRYGSTRVAATLLAEGADRRNDHRPLDATVQSHLGHTLAEPGGPLLAARGSGPELAARQADATLALMRTMTPQLRTEGLMRVYELECNLLPAVIGMEAAGIGLDAAGFQRIADEWSRERRTATQPERITRLDKLISTYGHWPRDFVDLDGRIRCRLHPLAADSGRFSCTDPNLQQVPGSRTAPGLRACFRPAEGHKFVIADYAQIELRVAAHLAPCDALRRVFREGRDPHRATAATVARKPESDISDHERQLAKAINFGFLFGMGAARFQGYARDSYGVELDMAGAKRAKDAFFQTFPGIAAWHRRAAALSRKGDHEDVVVRTALGRRKRFPAGRFSFSAALNIPVQGTAAEGFKLAMTRLHGALADLGGRGVLCVHDEYIAEVPEAVAEQAQAQVRRIMEASMAEVVPSVPIVADANITDAWSK